MNDVCPFFLLFFFVTNRHGTLQTLKERSLQPRGVPAEERVGYFPDGATVTRGSLKFSGVPEALKKWFDLVKVELRPTELETRKPRTPKKKSKKDNK